MGILRSKFGPALHHNEHQHKTNVFFLQFRTFLYQLEKRNVLTTFHEKNKAENSSDLQHLYVFQVFPVLDTMYVSIRRLVGSTIQADSSGF